MIHVGMNEYSDHSHCFFDTNQMNLFINQIHEHNFSERLKGQVNIYEYVGGVEMASGVT